MTAIHPTASDLFAYSCGVLTRLNHADIETHLQSCVQCLNILALLPEAPLAKLARKAVREVSVVENTPLPESVKRAAP